MATPPIIHQFWDKPVPPDDVAERMASWRAHYAGWEHRLWNDDTAADYLAERHGDEAVLCFRAAKLPAMRSDIFRLAVLVGEGGLYADADMLCLRPLDALADHDSAVRVEAGKQTGKARLNNNLMSGAPGAPLFSLAFAAALTNVRAGRFSLQVSRMTGPILMTKVWGKQMTDAERAAVRVITEPEFRTLVQIGGDLDYRKNGSHWGDEIRRRQIIDFAAARVALKRKRAADPAD